VAFGKLNLVLVILVVELLNYSWFFIQQNIV